MSGRAMNGPSRVGAQPRAPGPRVDIGRLRLHLPAQHQARAAAVARLVGEGLAAAPWSRSLRCEHLELRGLRLPATLDERELATRIVTAIFEGLHHSEHPGAKHG